MMEEQQQQQPKPSYDPHFTDRVIAATGPGAHPRLARVMPSLVRHLHAFAREVDLTVDEWMAGVEMINEAGRMSDSTRNETGLLCDVLGLESLVDEITSKKQQQQQQQQLQEQQRLQSPLPSPSSSFASSTTLTTATTTPTPSAILGPFYQADAPLRALGSSILQDSPSPPPSLLRYDDNLVHNSTPWATADPRVVKELRAAGQLQQDSVPLLTRIWGCVRSATTGRPVTGGATLEVWQSAPNGLYAQQDPEKQHKGNLRGRFVVGSAATATATATATTTTTTTTARYPPGHYALVCLKPTPYPIPDDGPAGRLLALLDRHPYRPGHVHFVVSAPGYRTLTTQIFDRDDPYIQAEAALGTGAGAGAGAGAGDAVFAVKEELLVEFRPVVLREGEEEGEEDTTNYGSTSKGMMMDEGTCETEGEEKPQVYRPRYELEFDFSLVEL